MKVKKYVGHQIFLNCFLPYKMECTSIGLPLLTLLIGIKIGFTRLFPFLLLFELF